MLRLLRLLVAAVAAVYLVVFAVQNRAPIDVVLWPGAQEITLPVWGLGLVGIVLGVVLAGVVIFFGGMGWRSEAIAAKRKLRAQERRREAAERREEQAAALRAAERRKRAEEEEKKRPAGPALAAPARGTRPLAISSS
jgi:uncharacterized integral membrane protein